MERERPPIARRMRQAWVVHFPFVLAVVAVAAALGVRGCGAGVLWIIGLLGAGIGYAAGRGRGGIAVAVGLAAAAGMEMRTRSALEAKEAVAEPGPHHVVARLLEDAAGSPRSWSAKARLCSGGPEGALVLWRGTGDLAVAGTELRATGDFTWPAPARNRGEFDRGAWMDREGMAAEFVPAGATRIEVPRRAVWSASLRHGFADAVAYGLAGDSLDAQVIRAMVIGERPRDADALLLDFRNSGALHLFCVSGLHVAMVAAIAWLILGACGIRRRQVAAWLIPIMFGYAWLTGYAEPAARAAWMGSVFLGAFLLRRKPDLLNALGTVLLAGVLWDGRILLQPGVQLSYGVVAVIALGVAPASRLFRWIAERDAYLPVSERGRLRTWLDQTRSWLASSLAVSLAAGAGSAPLTVLHFGIITPISLVANLVLLPLVSVILSCALLAALAYPVAPAVTAAVNRANAFLAGASARAAGILADVPGGHITTRRPGRAQLVVHDLPYGAMASVLTDSSGEAVMFDCGGRQSFRWSVLPSLRERGIRPRTVILSHPDGSHMGGGYPVWDMLPVETAVLPVREARSAAFRAWNEEARGRGVAVRHAAAGDRVAGPDASVWEALHVPAGDSPQALADDRVSVWRLHWRGWKFLFLADAGFRTEQDLLAAGIDLSADVVIAGKHRRDLSLGEELLAVVRPRVIVAKNPPYPPQERHPEGIVRAWDELGIRFVDQEASGGVTVTVEPDGALTFSGFLTPQRPLTIAGP